MGLLAIPGTAAGSAELCDNFAQLFKCSHSQRTAAEPKNPAALILGFITKFLDLARNEVQIRQSERCVPNSEISPEDFLLT
jgi:hypothetical protein